MVARPRSILFTLTCNDHLSTPTTIYQTRFSSIWTQSMQDRLYEKKKKTVERFIRKHGKVDHSVILNEVNIDYDTLMKIISELRREGHLKYS
jgi:hypothetical protein